MPPPGGPPPAYTRVVRKVYPYSLRPIMLTISIVGCIWSLIVGVESIKELGDEGATHRMDILSIVIGALYLLVAVIEVYAVIIAATQKTLLARFLMFLVPIGAGAASGAELVKVVSHFILKEDLIEQCTKIEVGNTLTNFYGNVTTLNDEQAQQWCSDSWNRNTWRRFVWFFAILLLSMLWISISLAYYRQLLDPGSVRERRPAVSAQQDFALRPQAPYHGYSAHSLPHHHGDYAGVDEQGYVPPYPGPPADSSPFALKHQDADAKEVHGDDMTYSAQERAWAEAQRSAPTANADFETRAGSSSQSNPTPK